MGDLKVANEQMSERIRLLNMRLCSAKQFLRRSPLQTIKCPRCGICPVTVKNSSMSAIDAKPSRASMKMTAASCQYIPVDASLAPKSTRDAGTETDQGNSEGTEKQCNENTCRTVMDELKQKIVNLQEELSKTHDEYSKRISKLEDDVSGLHQENMTVRSSKAASEHALQQKGKKADDLSGKLRESEGKVNDLKMQLSIEKRKVKELETTLKLAKTSNQTEKLIEKLNTLKAQPAPAVVASGSVSSYYSVKQDESRAPTPTHCICKTDLLSPTTPKSKEEGNFPKSDDSGCTDLNKSSDAEELKASYVERLNQEMLKKISDLQMQLDNFRIKAAGESAKIENQKLRDLRVDNDEMQTTVITITDANTVLKAGESAKTNNQKLSDLDNYDDEMQMTVITITEPNPVLEIQELGEKRKDFKTEKNIDTSTPNKDSEKDRKELAGISSKADIANVKSWNDLVQDMGGTSYKTEDFSFDKPNVSEAKRDYDNKYQIPGPIPTTYQTYADKKKPLKNSKITKIKDNVANDLVHKKGQEKCVKINDSSDNDVSDIKASDKAKISLKSDAITPEKTNETPIGKAESSKVQSQKIKTVDSKDAPVMDDAKKPIEDRNPTLSKRYSNSFTLGHTAASLPSEESKLTEDVKKDQTKPKHEMNRAEELAEMKKESSTNFVCRSNTIVTPPQSTASQGSKDKVANAQMDQTRNEFEDRSLCELGEPMKVAEKPQPPPPTVPPAIVPPPIVPLPIVPQPIVPSTVAQPSLRRDSATYTATPAYCDFGTYTAAPARRDSATFTKPELEKCERALSPANTERDVSSLSDLPPEKDGKSPITSPRDTRSPGEEKATSTYTDTDTRTNDYGPLSDGELPTHATLNRARKLSFGEQPIYAHAMPQSSEAQMEATLNAISEELAHCRKLLAAARDHEVRHWDRTS